jgi:hypothetical protein
MIRRFAATLYGDGMQKSAFVGRPNDSKMSSNGYTVEALGFNSAIGVLHSNADVADVYGSTDVPNVFTSTQPGIEEMQSGMSTIEVEGPGKVRAHAGTPQDKATILISPNISYTFVGKPTDSTLSWTDHTLDMLNFPNVLITSNQAASVPNSNVATLYGSSAGVNNFDALPDTAVMSGSSYTVHVEGFSHITGKAGTSEDIADLQCGFTVNGSTFTGKQGDSNLSWTDIWGSPSAGFVEVLNFHAVNASEALPSDVAYLNGSTHPSTFTGAPNSSQMSNHDYVITATNFDKVYAQAGTPADVAILTDVDIFGQTHGVSHFVGMAGIATMSGEWGSVAALNFRTVTGKAGNAQDTADVFGDPSHPNTFTDSLHTMKGTMASSAFSTTVEGFADVQAYAGTLKDVANLPGALHHANTFHAFPGDARMSNEVDSVRVHGFHTVNGTAGTSRDVADLFGDTTDKNVFTYSMQTLKGDLSSGHWHDTVSGFQTVHANAGTTGSAHLIGSQTFSNEFTGGPSNGGGFLGGPQTGPLEGRLDTGAGAYEVDVLGFNDIKVDGGTQWDSAYLYGYATERNLLNGYGGSQPSGVLYGADYRMAVNDFFRIWAYAETPSDAVHLCGDNPQWAGGVASISNGNGFDGTYNIQGVGFAKHWTHFD